MAAHKVRTEYYSYEYSFDGERFTEIPVKLDAKILSDDYVNQRYGASSAARSWVSPVLICLAMTRKPEFVFRLSGLPDNR